MSKTPLEPQPFYTEQWFTDTNFIPSNPCDIRELREKFEASVRRHLLAEVPYGGLLSGGLDSSLVASVCKREHDKLGSGEMLRSFCIGLKGSPDLKAAESVAKFLGMNINNLNLFFSSYDLLLIYPHCFSHYILF